MTNQIDDIDVMLDGKDLYTWAAKEVYESKYYKSALRDLCQSMIKPDGTAIKPHEVRLSHLQKVWVVGSKINLTMRAVAEYILEFYGIKPFELRNPDAIQRYGLKEDDMMIVNQFYPVDNKIMEFFKKEYGQDDNGNIKWQIEYNRTQNIVDVPQHVVDSTLQNLYKQHQEQAWQTPETSQVEVKELQ